MYILTNSNLSSDVQAFVMSHQSMFRPFKHVYLFGSILKETVTPEDIDLLLVYSKYSAEIADKAKQIRANLERQFRMPIDLTTLSTVELEDTNFLSKVVHYLKMK